MRFSISESRNTHMARYPRSQCFGKWRLREHFGGSDSTIDEQDYNMIEYFHRHGFCESRRSFPDLPSQQYCSRIVLEASHHLAHR